MLNLTAALAYHARTRANAEALIFESQRLDYATLYARTLRLAGWLAAEGVRPGSIVALLMKNAPAFVELTLALSHLGAVSLPMNYRLAREEVDYITGHAGAERAFVDDDLCERCSGLDIPVTPLDEAARLDSGTLVRADAVIPAAHPCNTDTLFRLMYTSGTTDRPKGVTHTYGNVYWKNIDHVIALGLSVADRLCVTGPLYHVGASDLPGLAVLWVGGTLVLQRDFDAAQTLACIARERVTGVWLPPVMLNAVLSLSAHERPTLSTLRWCVGGGERTPESRIRSVVEAFPHARFIDAYGMTETVSGDTMMEAGMELAKIGSTGRALPHVAISVRDDEGRSLPRGIEGEICMRGEKVTRGYWKDPERTADAFWPGGWLRSGDVGLIDADGFLFLTDRKKDLIISGGENIASSEVERVLYELPQVLEAAVVGRVDPRWGERPVAVVVLRDGAELSLDGLQAHCRRHLAGFKVPDALVQVDALPRNPSGKVLKRVLRERAC